MTEDDGEPRWTDAQRRELRLALEGRRRRTVRAGRTLAVALGAVVATGVLFRLPPEWWVPLVGVVALVGLAVRLVAWTCPSCGERLPTRGRSPICPGCGLPLD